MSRPGTSTPTGEPAPRLAPSDAGIALVLVLTATVLVASFGLSLLLLTDAEVMAAGNQRDAAVVFHAADAAVDLVTQELALLPEWTPVLAGTARSRLASALVSPDTSGGGTFDGIRLTAEVQQAAYGGSFWGSNTPRWRLFAHGVPGDAVGVPGIAGDVYLLVWVSDDAAEQDGAPEADANGVVVVRARAMGLRHSQCDVQVVVARTATAGVVRKLSWRVMR
jgi:hypothetical protein